MQLFRFVFLNKDELYFWSESNPSFVKSYITKEHLFKGLNVCLRQFGLEKGSAISQVPDCFYPSSNLLKTGENYCLTIDCLCVDVEGLKNINLRSLGMKGLTPMKKRKIKARNCNMRKSLTLNHSQSASLSVGLVQKVTLMKRQASAMYLTIFFNSPKAVVSVPHFRTPGNLFNTVTLITASLLQLL